SWGWAVNLGLIALIWWCAHRLTWDCTLIDETADSSGVGLLEVAGLEAGVRNQESGVRDQKSEVGGQRSEVRSQRSEVENRAERVADKGEPGQRKKKRREPGGLAGWWQRYRQYRAERKKQPRAPGVWVVYFSLAALPLFGLGQSQIPPD